VNERGPPVCSKARWRGGAGRGDTSPSSPTDRNGNRSGIHQNKAAQSLGVVASDSPAPGRLRSTTLQRHCVRSRRHGRTRRAGSSHQRGSRLVCRFSPVWVNGGGPVKEQGRSMRLGRSPERTNRQSLVRLRREKAVDCVKNAVAHPNVGRLDDGGIAGGGEDRHGRPVSHKH